jgi:hypothetical protein
VLLQPQLTYAYSVTICIQGFEVLECSKYIHLFMSEHEFFSCIPGFVNYLLTYVLQIDFLNKFLLLRCCVTCTCIRLQQDWCIVN